MNPIKTFLPAVIAGVGLLGIAAEAASPVPLFQRDDFQDGSLQNWDGQSVRTNVATGGPHGDGDRYLRVAPSPDGHVGAKNQVQWGGRPWQGEITKDYVTNGITGIAADVYNFGPDPLHLRILLTGHGRWASKDPLILPPDSGWQHTVFWLDEEHLVQVQGSEPLVNGLRDLSRYVIHHDPAPPSGHGGGVAVDAVLGIDNITAVPEPGMLALITTSALFAAGAAFRHRRTHRLPLD